MTSDSFPNDKGRRQSSPHGKSETIRGGVYGAIPTSASEADALKSFRYRNFPCPHCHTLLSATQKDVGKKVLCPDCDVEVTVPDYLDFDTPTEYERQYYDPQKRERDKILSPLTNPNREGLDMEGEGIYAVHDAGNSEHSPYANTEYYPIRCRVCETLMQVTRDMLGKKIACPDCGAETIVTDSLKRQQDSLTASFQPRERGSYEIGEIPEAPMIAVQKMNGKTVMIDPNQKSVAPTVKLSEIYRQKASETQTSYDDLSFVHPDEKFARPVETPQDLKRKKSEARRAKRAQRREKKEAEESDLTKFLPAMVLRRKNGELVWSLPSPPSRAPLFNKTFQAVRSEEIWARGGIVAICLLSVALIEYFILKPCLITAEEDFGTITGAFAQWEALGATCVLCFLILLTSSFAGLFFWSVYNAGNSGAKRVVEWRKEDLAGFFGYGVWFLAFVVISCLPGMFVSSVFNWWSDVDWLARFTEASFSPGRAASVFAFNVCFWLLFPVFWISTHQTDLPLCPITWTLFTSFLSKFHIWLEFYLFSAMFFLIPSFVLCMVCRSLFFVILSPFVIPAIELFYGLFLGRLSWILDDEVRRMDYDD